MEKLFAKGAATQDERDKAVWSAKSDRADPRRLERALEAYHAFETESSEFAVWLFTETGHGHAVPSYTNFMRADLEAWKASLVTTLLVSGPVPLLQTMAKLVL